MSSSRGKTVPLTLPRRWVSDILHFGKDVPIITGDRSLRVNKTKQAKLIGFSEA